MANTGSRGNSSEMGCSGALKGVRRAAYGATMLRIASSIFFCLAVNSASADIGLTLPRKQVLKSCMQDTSDRCNYFVFFNYQARSVLGKEEVIDSFSLRNVLPPQIGYMPFRTSREGLRSTCPIESLNVFVQRSLVWTRERLARDAVLLHVPDEISSCFQTTLNSNQDIFFVIRNDTINGFVSCRPDHVGIALCNVEFAREVGGLDERISISSFRREEIIELFSNFPQFPKNGRSRHEVNFLNALAWVRELFSSGVSEVRWGK